MNSFLLSFSFLVDSQGDLWFMRVNSDFWLQMTGSLRKYRWTVLGVEKCGKSDEEGVGPANGKRFGGSNDFGKISARLEHFATHKWLFP